ncbi:MAG: S-adenosyl-l-methionine hydroxide adenosyltransferase family protein [Gammaproteobacteria bacterium]
MHPIVTLTTDFGHKGPFVAVMKGVMLQHAPEVRIVDLTHEILVHWPAEAGFWLSRAYRYFPAGTVHVAVVDPGVGTERNIIAVEFDRHVFLAPDNGLLTLVIRSATNYKAWRLSDDWYRNQGWPQPSSTFHGRDIFAPLAAGVATGAILPAEIGPSTRDLVPSLLEEPLVADGEIQGSVVTIDHFGNLITNIDGSLIAALPRPRVRVGSLHLDIRTTYGDVSPGDFLALINSFGVLEIARSEGSAADGLGLGRGAPVLVRKN